MGDGLAEGGGTVQQIIGLQSCAAGRVGAAQGVATSDSEEHAGMTRCERTPAPRARPTSFRVVSQACQHQHEFELSRRIGPVHAQQLPSRQAGLIECFGGRWVTLGNQCRRVQRVFSVGPVPECSKLLATWRPGRQNDHTHRGTVLPR